VLHCVTPLDSKYLVTNKVKMCETTLFELQTMKDWAWGWILETRNAYRFLVGKYIGNR